jgi:hypothetical protein
MRKWLIFIGMTALLAGGCISNTNPVLKPEQLITDKAVLGSWVENSDKNPMTADIHPPGDDKSAEVSFTTGGNDAEGKKQHEATMRLGKINDLEVVEFKLKPEDRDHRSQAPYVWAILRQADAGGITADVMDTDWLKKYAVGHPDELATKPDPDGNSIIITASTDDFQKFLLAHAKDNGAFTVTHWVRPGAATEPAGGS